MNDSRPGLHRNIMLQILAMAAHHLELHSMTDSNSVWNACYTYNYILAMAKPIRAQGAECPEMIHTSASVKKTLTKETGIAAQIVENWAKQNADYLRSKAQQL